MHRNGAGELKKKRKKGFDFGANEEHRIIFDKC
jgi:hypothetical protein